MANFDAPIFNGEGRGDDPNPIDGNYQGFPMMYGEHGEAWRTEMQFQTPIADLAQKRQLTPAEKAARAKIYRTRSSQKKKKEEQDRKKKLKLLKKENKKLLRRNESLERKLEIHGQENVQFRTRMNQLEQDNKNNKSLLSALEMEVCQSGTNIFHHEIENLRSQFEAERVCVEATVLPYLETNYMLSKENVELKLKIKKLELTVEALLNDKIAKKHGEGFQE